MKRIFPLISFLALAAFAQEAPKPPAEAKPPLFTPAAQKVIDASEKNELDQAYKLATTGAAEGDLDCIFFIGRMLERGLGVKADPAKAVEQYKLASAKDHQEAKSNWARCLEFGVGVKADPEKADFLNQQAAEAGFVTSQSRMGILELDGIRRPKNDKAALEWFTKAATHNDGAACFWLSQFYRNKWAGLEENVGKSLEYALRGANLKNLDAMNLVGLFYQYGYGLQTDKVAAAGWFNFAAQHDHPPALSNLGQCYEVGQGFKINLQTAARIYADAAKFNDPTGCLCLARCFRDGIGVEKNLPNAYINFARSALLGIKAAEQMRDEVKAKLSAKELENADAELKRIIGK